MNIFYAIGIILSSIAGLLISNHIKKHRDKDHLVCHKGGECKSLVKGRFSRFLGLRNELIGEIYYVGIASFFIANIFISFPEKIIWAAILLTGISFIFSAYLIVVQLFVVKKWCSLCLGSAGLSFMILVLAILGFDSLFTYYIFGYREFLEIIFVLALVAGTIVSTLHARLMIRFFRDFEISKKESKRLSMFSQSAWVAIMAASLSGLGLILTDIYGEVTGKSSFLALLVVVAFMVIYEVVLNTIIAPRLVDIHLGDHPEIKDHEYSYQRKIAFAYLGVGAASWYSALLLTTISWFRVSEGALLIGYLVLIILAALVSLFLERILYQRSLRNYSFTEDFEYSEDSEEELNEEKKQD